MAFVLVRHKVEDYEKWKPVFDDHGIVRKTSGCKGGYVFRSADNPNEVMVLLEWEDHDRARQFTESENLKKTMEQAGVTDHPDIYFLDEAARPSE
jgi:heme-degrading monooxygenase HmoA